MSKHVTISLYDKYQKISAKWLAPDNGDEPIFVIDLDEDAQILINGYDTMDSLCHAVETALKDFVVSRQSRGEFTQPDVDQLAATEDRELKYADEYQGGGVL